MTLPPVPFTAVRAGRPNTKPEVQMDNDPLAAFRGILNGVVAGVILWAGIACLLFYGFRVAI